MTTSPNTALDASIPVLTEIVTPGPALPAQPPAPAHATLHDGAASVPTAPQAGIRTDTLGEADWSALQRQLTERILYSLAERVDFVVEQRVRDALAEVIHGAVGALAAELQRGLHQTLDEMVARAVDQEIAKLRAGRPHP